MRSENNIKFSISCDGGAASGKTTGAKLISKKYNLRFLSSGLLYRYASFLLLKHKPKNKISFLKKKFKSLNYKKISDKNLHTQKNSSYVSIIAKEKKVRTILKKFQLIFARKYKNVCIEGRDISYAILPRADIKFFFVCNLDTASKRRWKELKKRNKKIKLKEVKKTLKIRDFNDKNRKHNPLIKSSDSIVIRSDILNKRDMVKKMSEIVNKKLKQKYGFGNKRRK
tara:strand:- start:205 stop:882 length:678 start_codon:yes stop_codon:yes gene_type:complete